MAALSRTVYIRFPQTDADRKALREQHGLSNQPRRQRATTLRDDRSFIRFGKSGPSGLNMPYGGDVK